MDTANLWLNSQLPAFIRGARLYPKPHHQSKDLAYYEEGKQGLAFHLVQKSNKREWILKKFHPPRQLDRDYLNAIRSLAPPGITFSSASRRVVLAKKDLQVSEGLYTGPDFENWLDGCILMKKVDGKSWKQVAQNLKTGKLNLPLGQRLLFARNLSQSIDLLMEAGCAHRDLSHENLFLDLQEYVVYLVDWDSMYHSSLSLPENSMVGTPGYIAPWLRIDSTSWDKNKSWQEKADLFALSILIAEILLTKKGTSSPGEGVNFSQKMLLSKRDPYMAEVMESFYQMAEPLGDLFRQTIMATSFEECPQPVDWIEALDHLEESLNEDKEEDDDSSSSMQVVEDEALEEKEEDKEEDNEEDNEEDELPEGVTEIEDAFEKFEDEDSEENSESLEEMEYEEEDILVSSSVNKSPLFNREQVKKISIAILIFLFLLVGHYFRDDLGSFFSSSGGSDSIPTTQIKSANDSSAVSEDGTPMVTPLEKYSLKILYTHDDLKMSIRDREVALNMANQAYVDIAPGNYPLSLTFTGVKILSDGREQYSDPKKITNTIRFGDNQDIIIQIDRQEETWKVLGN